MNKAFKRFASFMLALALVMCTMPLEALAEGILDTTVLDGKITVTTDGVSGLASAVKKDDGSITVTTTATSKCISLGKYEYSANPHTVTITNSSASETVALEFQYQAAGLGTLTIDGENKTSFPNGTIAKTLAPGDTIIVVLTSPASGNNDKGNSATITFSNFTEKDDGTKNVTVKAGVNATVSVAGTAITADKTVATTYTDGVAVSVKPADGYEFIGWQDANGKALSTLAAATINPAEDMTVSAVVAPKNSTAYWLAGEKYHTDLTAACTAAQAGDKVAVLLNNGTLSGQHTIPADVTVLIPYNDAFSISGADPVTVEIPSSQYNPTAALFRKLTMASGAVLTVNGALELGAKHWACHGGKQIGGTPYDGYGQIEMGSNAAITVNNGGNLYAWGYITGSNSANVTINSGARVYEKFQVTDYHGGSLTGVMLGASIFAFNQYYVQNIEVRETVHSGASLICHAGIYGEGVNETAVDFMSANGMFKLESGYVTKYYDASTDRLILDINGNISLNPITMDFDGVNYNTESFELPLNDNITINVNNGSAVTINQDVMLMPGTEINVRENATLNLATGKKAYLINKDNWDKYCFGAELRPLRYVGSRAGAPVTRSLSVAKMDINGNLLLNGQLYNSQAGALITSSGKTGIITFNTAAPTDNTSISQSLGTGGSGFLDKFDIKAKSIAMVPAVLTNGANADVATVDTKGVAAASIYQYCPTCDKWYMPLQVTYDANAGVNTVTGEMAEQNLAPCHDTKLAKNLFESESMNFKEWNTAADGKGTVYADEGELTDIKSTVLNLFAQWIVKATWMKGSEKLDETDVLYNTVPAVTEKDASKPYDDTYHYQTGWSTTPDGEAQDLTAITAHTTYYAVYTPVEHKYSLDTTKGTDGYEWSADGKSCTAYGKCVCGDTVELAATMSSSVTTPGTCKTEEVVTWKAAFAETWATEQSTPVTGVKNTENHAGTEVTYSNDGMTHSAVYNCCGSEFVTGQEHTFEEGKCICGADEPVKGDVDLDGKVEASDLTTLCRHVAKIEYVTDEVALHNADVTGDGVLAADDLTMLARYVAKIIDSLD